MALGMEKIAFTVVLHAGNAKAEAYSAIAEAKNGNFDNVDELIECIKEKKTQWYR